MRLALALFAGLLAQAQTPLRPLHVSPAGIIVDDSGKPALLRGLNRSGTGSGNADATATDSQYAAQNQLLPMNLVRIFVNANWWNNNVQIPIANLTYQDYIDQLIQRVKKYGNYVLVVKAGQFPDPPCGASGVNCPLPNQGDVNCQGNAALCAAQDTTGNNIDPAINFWSSFARKYASDPAVLYDTWEDMHGIDANTWSDNQNELIAVIRTYSPTALVFLEDTGTEFNAISSGVLADLAWSNLVWDFHLYTASSGACTEPASARYNNWPQNLDPLVTYAQQHGHAVAITEWGGCNDPEPYHTNITSYARSHSITLVYFDSSNVIGASGLTPIGAKVAQAYAAVASSGPGNVVSVLSANGATTLAAEAIASAFGANLATAPLQGTVPLQVNLGGTSVIVTDVNGVARPSQLFYVSPAQINYEVPPGVAVGAATVAVTVNGAPVGNGVAQIAPISPGIYTATADGKGIAAAVVVTIHADRTSSFIVTFQCNASGCTPNPIDLGLDTDQVVLELYGTGIRGRSSPSNVTCKIGPATLTSLYAGPQGTYVGEDQINFLLPKSLRGAGNMTVQLNVDGQAANAVTLNFK